jgi:hypothetical protein
MTAIATSLLKQINIDDLKALARYTGPCVTIQIPGYQPGTRRGSRLAHLRQLTQAAVDGLRKIHMSDEATQVAAALERLIPTLPLETGGQGITLFCAPHFEAAYETPGPVKEEVAIGSHFHLVPQLSAAQTLQEFFVLGISRNRLRLFQYRLGACKELPLPTGVPRSLAEAGGFDKPDHTQESRSSGGPSVGAMHGVRFGTSSDHDSEGEYIRHFFEQVDKGLKDTLQGAPLFLAGVQEEVTVYRKAAKHAHLLGEECHGNIDHASADEVARHAGAAARREYRAASERALSSLPHNTQRLTTDPESILAAAQEGRVRQVFVAEDARMARANVPGIYVGEDIINAAVVEALRTGADVFSVPGNEIENIGPLAAVLRF